MKPSKNEYESLLATWQQLKFTATVCNQMLAFTAYRAVTVFVASGGERKEAIRDLAKRALIAKRGDTSPLKARYRNECQIVNGMIHAGAVMDMIFDATIENNIICMDGIARKEATEENPAMPWRKIRELLPLVQRESGSTAEKWIILPCIEPLELIQELPNLKAGQITDYVRELCAKDAKDRLKNGDTSAAEDLDYWRGKHTADKLTPNQIYGYFKSLLADQKSPAAIKKLAKLIIDFIDNKSPVEKTTQSLTKLFGSKEKVC